MKAARNSAIACACLLAVIEGVGIGFQRMMAENTRLDVGILGTEIVRGLLISFFCSGPTTSTTSGICRKLSDTFTRITTSSRLSRHVIIDSDITLHSKVLIIKAYNSLFCSSLAVISGRPCLVALHLNIVWMLGTVCSIDMGIYQYVLYAVRMLHYSSNEASCVLAIRRQLACLFDPTN